MTRHPRPYTQTSSWRGSLKRRLFERDRGCVVCGDPGEDGKGKGLHKAHLVPHPLGPDDESNLVLLCSTHHREHDAAQQRELRRRWPDP